MEQLVGVVGIFGAWTATALLRTFIGLLALLLFPILASGAGPAGSVQRIVDGDTLALLVEGANGLRGLCGHGRELVAVAAGVDHLMGHNEVVLSIHSLRGLLRRSGEARRVRSLG